MTVEVDVAGGGDELELENSITVTVVGAAGTILVDVGIVGGVGVGVAGPTGCAPRLALRGHAEPPDANSPFSLKYSQTPATVY